MAAFLTQDAYDQFTLSKEEYELAQELKEESEKEKSEDSNDSEPNSNITIDWENLDDRIVRLTKNSANSTRSCLLEDASKLFFLKRHADGSELWMRDFREDDTKLLKKLDRSASFDFTADEQTIFILSGGSLSHATVDAIADAKPVSFNAVMTLNPVAERAYMFEHGWRQITDKF